MMKSKEIEHLHVDGTRSKGMEVRQGNVRAATQLANILKSSYGPHGLDKMLVNSHGEITITNDGAKILSELNVEHPAAKILVKLAKSQDHQVGDGTTSVVIVAAELLKSGLNLIENDKIHPSNVITGYRLACKEALKHIEEKLLINEKVEEKIVKSLICTTINTKVLSSEPEHFTNIVYDSLMTVRKEKDGKSFYPLKSINIVKHHGRSMKESQVVDGYALQAHLASQMMVKRVEKAKIALLDYDLRKSKLKMGIAVEVNDPKQLQAIRDKEISLIKDRINLVLEKGANVILTTKAIDELCQKFLIEKGCMGVRRVDKEHLRRIAKLCGGEIVSEFTNEQGVEVYSETSLGLAEVVVVERISDDNIIFIRGGKKNKACSIVLRGANDYLLDEMHRTIHDALSAARRVLENKKIVPGGGAVEGSLSVHLEDYARTIETREQLAVSAFADSLLVIPKTLAVNAAMDSTELVAKLRAYHHKGLGDTPEFLRYGLDLTEGKVVDQVKNGVLEPALTKQKVIEFATESAITILRIDDMWKMNPKKQEDPRRR